ncbi:unnamed protein product [Candida parapsilosis]|nr:unnamed protein product [Candida parapsilosis]
MAKLRDNYGVKIFKLDVTNSSSVKDAKTYIQEETLGNHLDILFNNAGQTCQVPTTDVTDEQFAQCFKVNVFGAIQSYASVLRIEMKPFKVKVINFITGMVRTNIEDTRGLPETSLFNVPGMKEAFEEIRLGVTKNNPTPADSYAKQVVDDFEKAKLGGSLHLYHAKMAFILGFISPLLPRCILEGILIRKLKLTGPFEYLKEKYTD